MTSCMSSMRSGQLSYAPLVINIIPENFLLVKREKRCYNRDEPAGVIRNVDQ